MPSFITLINFCKVILAAKKKAVYKRKKSILTISGGLRKISPQRKILLQTQQVELLQQLKHQPCGGNTTSKKAGRCASNFLGGTSWRKTSQPLKPFTVGIFKNRSPPKKGGFLRRYHKQARKYKNTRGFLAQFFGGCCSNPVASYENSIVSIPSYITTAKVTIKVATAASTI